MSHLFEKAPTGRAKCRGCGRNIAAGELRFGERLPNPFAEGEMTQWFHVDCAAYKRPEPFLEALSTAAGDLPDSERLEAEARRGIDHRRLPRVNGAERASTGRAQCRSCREAIKRGSWRISLVYYEEGRFVAGGFIHVRCSKEYFETTAVLGRLAHFSPELNEEDLGELRSELETSIS